MCLQSLRAVKAVSNVTPSVIFESAVVVEGGLNADFRPSLNKDIRSVSSTVCYFYHTCIGFPHQGSKNRQKQKKRGRERQFSEEWEGGRG